MTSRFPLAVLAAVLVGLATPAAAVPPLVIGDAPTADRGHAEWYLGVQWVKSDIGELSLPTTELVLGVSDWQELTVEAPYLSVEGQQGVGDIVLGTKVRLLPEEVDRPGLAASLEWKLPNGSQAKGLGTGASELGLLLRGQKSWGRVTGIVNAGYSLVGDPKVDGVAVPHRNTGFLGAGVEAELGGGATLMADAYWQSADVAGEPARIAGDLGMKYDLGHGLAVDASVGRSLRLDALGGPELRVYGGFKWEFGVF